MVGRPVTFTATVCGGTAGNEPTGTVEFREGATLLGSATLAPGGGTGCSQATFTTATLAAGNHPITAHYLGDSAFAPSTSDTITQRVVDEANCASQPRAIVGTPGGDVVTPATNSTGGPKPTAGPDVICALAGGDSIDGGGGDDIVFAGPGSDSVNGGAGNDAIDGGDGNDNLRGGTGDDFLRGADGNDALFGEDGADTLDGGTGTDSCNGGPGTDSATTCEASSAIP
jgi:Ca2+-binding RTX toxin-like protein